MSVHQKGVSAEYTLLPGNKYPSVEYESVDCIICRRRDEAETNLLARWSIESFPKIYLIADYTEANLRAGLLGGEPVIGVTSQLKVDTSIDVGLADDHTLQSGLLDVLAEAEVIKKCSQKGFYRINHSDLPNLSEALDYIGIVAWNAGDGLYSPPDFDYWLFGKNGVGVKPSKVNPLLDSGSNEALYVDDIPW